MHPRCAVAALALSALTPLAAAQERLHTVYEHDFESAVGGEWSTSVTAATSGFTSFLGRFSNTSVRLTLHSLEVGALHSFSFDFLAIDSWDGDDARWGRDVFGVRINGQTVLEESFSNTPAFAQSYDGDPDIRYVNLGFASSNDAIYRAMTFEFLALSQTLTVDFFATGLQHISDESWGIDNVRLSSLSVPPAPSAALALIALGGGGRRERRRR